MLVKIIDELNEKDTYDKYQENIIEENVKRISGKLETRHFEAISISVYWS